MTNLTAAEAKTIRVILRNGGSVRPTMGALVGRCVRKTTLSRLEAKGLVRIVAGRDRSGPYEADVEVTVAGCLAINAVDADAAYRALMEAAEQAAADRRNAEGEAPEQEADEDRPDANDLRVDLYGDTMDHGDR